MTEAGRTGRRSKRRQGTARRASKRVDILDAAIAVTAKRGLGAASLAAVAGAAGVSKALVVYHFGSMPELRREMTTRVGQRFADAALGAAVRTPGTLQQRALATLDELFHPRNRVLFLAMHELFSIAPREPEVAATVRDFVDPARKLVAAVIEGQEDPVALEAAGRVVAAVHGYISLWIWCGAGDPTPWRNDAEEAARALLSDAAARASKRKPEASA